jgi:Fic family protein
MDYEHLVKVFYKNRDEYESIYQKQFTSESSYSLPIMINDSQAFFVVNMEMLDKVAKIYNNTNELNGLLANELMQTTKDKLSSISSNKFLEKCLIEEIILTNEIEGIHSSRKEILDVIESKLDREKKLRFQGLVEKYSKLFTDEEIDFSSCSNIRKLYNDIVINEMNENDLPDGEFFRKDTVNIVSSQEIEHKGLYPESKIIDAMENSFKILKDEKIAKLFRIAIFHYLIGYIHPFYDGNGRLSRFISSYLLKQELNKYIALKLSYAIKNNKKKYYNAFEICNDPRNKGELTFFIYTFIDFVKESTICLINDLKDSLEKLRYYFNIFHMPIDLKKQTILWNLIQNYIFSNNQLTLEELVKYTEINETTLRQNIMPLIEDQFIIKNKEGHKNIYSIQIDKIDEMINENSVK